MSDPNDAVFLVPQANIDAYNAYAATSSHTRASSSGSSSRHTTGHSQSRKHSKATKPASLPHTTRSHGSGLPPGVEEQRF